MKSHPSIALSTRRPILAALLATLLIQGGHAQNKRADDRLSPAELPKPCPRNEDGQPVYLREIAVLAIPDQGSKTITDLSEIIDLSARIDADGTLRWDVPDGKWAILRFVCTNHGQQLIVPYLPALAGWNLADQDAQERFHYDWRKFVSDRLIGSK